MDSYDETLHGRYLTSSSSSAVNRDPTRQWFYKSFEPNLESAIVNTPAAAADDASQIMHITDTTAFPSPDDVAAATAAVAKNKRKKNRKRKQEHDQIRKSTSTTLKNKRIMKETNRDSMATLQPQEFADTSVTAIAGTVPTTDVINIGNVTPVETAIIATNTSYTSSAGT
jgi:hypothetical protein